MGSPMVAVPPPATALLADDPRQDRAEVVAVPMRPAPGGRGRRSEGKGMSARLIGK